MKQFRRRRTNDDRHLKSMARTDQLKADRYRDQTLVMGSVNAVASSSAESTSRVLANPIRPSRTFADRAWLDSSGAG